jgi:RsiW-degrading membrane proteinase PrsW (M82 family)
MIWALYLGTLIPLLFLVIFVKKENRLLLLFMLWGLTAVLPSAFFNQLIFNKTSASLEEITSFAAPLIEEFFKGLPLLLFLFFKKNMKSSFVLFLAMASGIGFSIHENFVYLSQFPGDDFFVVALSIIRSFSTSLMHGVTVVVFGFSVVSCRKLGRKFSPMIIGAYWSAVIIHSLYNTLVDSVSYSGLALLVPLLVFIFIMFSFSLVKRKKSSPYWE